jgi:excisionase family DNA binding protein
MDMNSRLLWDVKEAALALGLSPWTIRRYIRDRQLASIKVGRRVLVEPSECRRFVDDKRRIAGNPNATR